MVAFFGGGLPYPEAMQDDAVGSRRSSNSDGDAFASWKDLVSDFGKVPCRRIFSFQLFDVVLC